MRNQELLIQAIDQSTSRKDVLRFLVEKGVLSSTVGQAYRVLTAIIDELKLDTAHFTTTNPKWTVENGLRLFTKDDHRKITGASLRRLMLEIGFTYECHECKLEPEWQGKALVLDIDHINGDHYDNRKENLRFLCPNCHRQTPTWGWKGKRKHRRSASGQAVGKI